MLGDLHQRGEVGLADLKERADSESSSDHFAGLLDDRLSVVVLSLFLFELFGLGLEVRVAILEALVLRLRKILLLSEELLLLFVERGLLSDLVVKILDGLLRIGNITVEARKISRTFSLEFYDGSSVFFLFLGNISAHFVKLAEELIY